MKATLNIKKTDLVGQLENRLDEIKKKYDEYRKETQDVIDARATAGSNAEEQAAYYESIALGLRIGDITINEKTGKLRGAPAKPSTKSTLSTESRATTYLTTDQLKDRIDRTENEKTAVLKPVETALKLLSLATDEVIEVDTTDYHNLLNGTNSRFY